jgi:2-amino-4-hydroxy-6-hydroxymethyldihydropteridine diphosphokinase
MARALVALGANLGNRAATIAQAIGMLRQLEGTTDLKASSVHETQPVGGAPDQQPFLNAAVRFDTTLSPEKLHARLAQIESELGRQRGDRWAARTIDLDLLLYDDLVLDTRHLIVPHPRMAWRRFVLEPAAEVGGEMRHPCVQWTVAQLLAHLNTALPYIALLGPPGSGKTALAERLARACEGRVIYDPVALARESLASQAGAAGPAAAQEIEFLARRAEVLARATWPVDEMLAVSDFYLDQGMAYALATQDPEGFAAFVPVLAELRKQVVLPKLLVVLDTSRSKGDSLEMRKLREALSLLAARPNEGPVLRINADDVDEQIREVTAAVQSMR